jgi:hypothetical protein
MGAANIEAMFYNKRGQQENLGFGYHFVNGSYGQNETTIFYSFVYYDKKLVSYRLRAKLPYNNRLTNRYLKMYARLFTVKGQTIQPVYYGLKDVSDHLKGTSLTTDNGSIQYLMSPFSGTTYGDRGGYSGSLLENRANYISIKKLMTPQVCELLLYSKNPATRLCAAEYYYQHLQQFKPYKAVFEKRIEAIYKELPEVDTMSGCIGMNGNSRELVALYAKRRNL